VFSVVHCTWCGLKERSLR